jgi:hypothetical protein
MDSRQPRDAAWEGFRVQGNTLITDNGEAYTAAELRGLRWERNQWATLARQLQREIERAGTDGAVWFDDTEWRAVRDALRVLDARLPGVKLTALETKRGRAA